MRLSPLLSFSAIGSAVLISALASAVPAQTVSTVPINYAAREGNALSPYPFAYLPSRIQCGYDGVATGWKAPRFVTKITARADSLAELRRALSVEVQLVVSSVGSRLLLPSSKFDDNHGRDRRVFLARRRFDVKPFTNTLVRRPFDLEMKGDAPFLVVGGNLIVDWAVYAKTRIENAAFYVDADRPGRFGRAGTAVRYGRGCNTQMSVAVRGFNVQEMFTVSCMTFTSLSEVALSWISPKRVDIALGGGCALYADPTAPGAFLHPVPAKTSGPNGWAPFSWGNVPVGLIGQKIYVQAAAFPSQGSLRWSDGIEVTFGSIVGPYLTAMRAGLSVPTQFDPDRDPGLDYRIGEALIFKID